MGYYTCFNLAVFDTNGYVDKDRVENFGLLHRMAADLNKISDDYFGISPDDTIYDIVEYDSMKWYDHEEHMIELSRKYSGYCFELYGTGEDSDDRWRARYQNGKWQVCRARITYEPWDNKYFNDMEDDEQ